MSSKNIFICLITTVFLCRFAGGEEEILDLTEKRKESSVEEYVGPAKEQKLQEDVVGKSTSTSVSKLFIVSGGNASLRSEIARLADQVTEELRIEIKDGPPKQVENVVHIVIHPKRANAVKGSPYRRQFGTSLTGDFYIRLDVDSGSGLKREPLRSAITEMLLLERSLREVKDIAPDQKLVLHAWVVDGLLEVINWRANLTDRAVYRDLNRNPNLFDLKKLLDIKRSTVEQMDASTFKVYKASSGALVMALLNQPNGVENFRFMLSEVSLFQGDMEDLLRRYFPQVNKGKEGVKIAWMLQLAAMSLNSLSDSLTILQTEEKLDDALLLKYIDEQGNQHSFPLDDLEKLKKLTEEQRKLAMVGVAKKVVHLNYRCFPLYRSILMGYSTSINALSMGYYKDVDIILKNLASERKLQKQAATRARNYLDWYMINHSTKVKGNYRAFDAIDAEFEDRLLDQRSGRLSNYLDVIEKFYR